MSDQPITRRKSSMVSNALIGIALLFAFGFGVGFTDDGWVAKFIAGQPWLWLAFVAAFCTLSFAAGAIWMRSIDELAQRAHYEAWYWGGSVGLAAMMFLALASPTLGRFIDFEAVLAPVAFLTGDATGFASGVIASILVMSIGYGAWWLAFWLRKR
ncbi:MAG: hypothetical protein SGJ23_14575 [Alphaproteobacteria bacterium]|nr:hypothetical protein [Alphaproteobacteria bacterium]